MKQRAVFPYVKIIWPGLQHNTMRNNRLSCILCNSDFTHARRSVNCEVNWFALQSVYLVIFDAGNFMFNRP